MKRIVRTLSLLLCGALLLAGCHISTPATVLTVDGTDIPAGIYLWYQMQAYSTASGKVEDSTNVLKGTIDGKSATDWIHTETLRLCRRYVYIQNECKAQNITLTDDELATAKSTVESNFSSYGSYYEKNGIGQASYLEAYLAEQKYSALYTAYETANADSITDDDAMAYMDKTYAHVTTVLLPITDTSGANVSADKLKTIQGYANDLADALKAADADADALSKEYLQKACDAAGTTFSEDSLSNYETTTFITADSTSYPEDLVAEMMKAKVGDTGVYLLNDKPYVYLKLANYKDADDFAQYRDALVNGMLTEKYDAQVDETAAKYEVTEDASAVKTYSPKKIKIS